MQRRRTFRVGHNQSAAADTEAFSGLPPAGTTDPTGQDLTSAREAFLAFTRALDDGDAQAARSWATGTNEQFSIIDAVADWQRARKHFDATASEKFGIPVSEIGHMWMDLILGVEGDDAARSMLSMSVKGNVASVNLPPYSSDDPPLVLKKDASDWRDGMGQAAKEMAPGDRLWTRFRS